MTRADSAAVAAPRMTTKGRAILDALRDNAVFLSAQDLYSVMRSAGSRIGLATVYRHLQTFADDGTVDVIRARDGESRYRYCGDAAGATHHHHLVCRSCGRAEEVAGSAVERWARRVADEHGFVDVNHTIEVYGICGQCSRQTGASR